MIFTIGFYLLLSIVFIAVIHQLINHVYSNFTKTISRDLQPIHLQQTNSTNSETTIHTDTSPNEYHIHKTKQMKNELKHYFKELSNTKNNKRNSASFLQEEEDEPNSNLNDLFDSYSMKNTTSINQLNFSEL